jgi:hypothetical protein
MHRRLFPIVSDETYVILPNSAIFQSSIFYTNVMAQTIIKSVSLIVLFVAAITIATLSANAQTTSPQANSPQVSSSQAATVQPASNLDEPEGEALFNGPLRSTGYGALGFKFTPIQGNFATLLGGYGGWFINKSLLIGGGGYGLTSQVPSSVISTAGQKQNISFGYGGIVLEYIGLSDKVFHYAVQGFVGWGGAGYFTPSDRINLSRFATTLMVFEPSVLAELNVTNFLRISAGGGYRIVTGSTLEGLTNADLSSYSISLNIKFGSF